MGKVPPPSPLSENVKEMWFSCVRVKSGVKVEYERLGSVSEVLFSSDRDDSGQVVGKCEEEREVGRASLVLGVYKVKESSYLGLVTRSSPVKGVDAYALPATARRVDEVDFVRIESGTIPQEEAKELNLLRNSFSRHDFYFCSCSDEHDITRTIQGNAQKKNGAQGNDSRFFWNEKALDSIHKAIDKLNVSEKRRSELLNIWITPVTNAAISSCQFELNKKQYALSLVSRRSRSRQGPRLQVRGIDINGDVANFVETEQVLTDIETGDVASFVQVRGSIPLFWKQPDKYMPKPRVILKTKRISDHINAFSNHLLELMLRYVMPEVMLPTARMDIGPPRNDFSIRLQEVNSARNSSPSILLLNLVDKSSFQGFIGRAWARILSGMDISKGESLATTFHDRDSITLLNYKLSYVPHVIKQWANGHRPDHFQNLTTDMRFVWYDFNRLHRGSAFRRSASTRKLLHPIKDMLISNSSFYMSSTEKNQMQSTIFRTNCLDCLDRTNVAQVYLPNISPFSFVTSIFNRQRLVGSSCCAN